MADVLRPARSIRFGVFELDLHSGELRKAGVLIGLQEQSLKVLRELLNRPGELVTREQLRQRLWPDGTFVDFDHGLNAVINRLRETLGDSADAPRFIQTVPRRGYRFITPVERGVEGEEVREQPTCEPGHIRPESGGPGSAGRQGATQRSSSVKWRAVVLTLAIGAALSLYLFRFRPSPPGSMRTTPLTSLPGKERDASFSPDGGQIAFVWDGEKGDNEDIYVKVIGTEVPLRLTTNPAPDRYPVWSPDGRQIAFARASTKGSELFVMPALGGPERKIQSRSSSLDHCSGMMSWSPDGQLLAIADREGDQYTCSIFLVSLQTLQKRKLTSPSDGAGGDYAPAFSPDGRTIAFNRFSPAGGGIHVVAAAGGVPRRVTLQQYFWYERLAWLPNGRELLFSSHGGDRDPDSSSTLWKVSASGGTPERLGVGGDNAANPAVSPLGNRLAYEQRLRDTNIWKIALPESTRPAPAPLRLIASSRQDYAPHVSPDGARVAFLSDRSGSDEIWLCNTAGSNQVQLTSSGGSFGTPRWSPDSRHLAFERVKGHPGVYVISADGGLPREVTTDPSAAVLASWSSDGRWIYFGSNRTGRVEVWKVRAEGGRAVQVTKGGGFRAFESADGKFVYYAKSFDLGGVWKVPVNGGEETAVLDFPKATLWGYWALVNDGIYFVDAEGSSRPALRFFDFGTSRVSHVVDLEGKPTAHEPGLAISPDGKWLLYEQVDYRSVDIMLVESFH